MKVSPHTHAESPLTGSTIIALVDRAKELGRTHITYTDHGHVSSALKMYSAAKKKGLKFIPGIEIYFKDSKCPIISGSVASRCKYFTASIYCEDQEAFQELCKIVSGEDMPKILIKEEDQQLWGWSDLEKISKFNVNIVLSGVHCMVGKPMLAGDAQAGQQVLLKLISIFGVERVYGALLCESWQKKWTNVIEIQYTDGTKDAIVSGDMVSTNRARRLPAKDLVENKRHGLIKTKTVAGITFEVNKYVDRVVLHKGFLPLGKDVTLITNKFLLALQSRHKFTLLVTDYAYYAKKEDKIVQTMRSGGADKLQPNLHMKDSTEILNYLVGNLGLGSDQADQIMLNNSLWANDFDNLKLDYGWRLATPEGDALTLAMDIIKQNGRMKWDNPQWVERLKYELEVIAKNPVKDLTPYFLPIRDVLNHYKDNGRLPGPGRGSSGGSLFCYLLGITEIDPFEYDLPFNRFFSMERINLKKLPDIDVDLEDRELLVGADGKSGYLYGRWGNKAAQISTRTTIRLKSAIKDTNRYFNGKVEAEIEKFTEGLPAPPQGVSDAKWVFGYRDDEDVQHPGLIEQSVELQQYVKKRPQEWEIVTKAMGLTRAFSRHASAFVIADIPIKNVVPTKDGNITQYEAKEAEAAGLIKYDFLVINQLKDIRVCLDLIKKKHGYTLSVGDFVHQDTHTNIWHLPKDEDVFKSVWGGSTETLFQINTKSMIPVVMEILPKSIMDLSNILALVRPGPMDMIDPETGRTMVQEYIMRLKGQSEPDIQELFDILPETYGILIYQEQLGKVAKELAGFSAEKAEILRENMAKKRMVELVNTKPAFIEGASKKVSKEIAESIWERMVTFGRYGFSIIHAVEYAHITYACMFLRHHYPLEWWAAILTNAEEKEITGIFWPYVKEMVLPPDINLSTDTFVVDYANEKLRSKLSIIRGVGGKTMEPILAGRPYKDIQDFVDKDVAGPSLSNKLIHVGVLDSLFPPKSPLQAKLKMYADAIENNDFQEKVKKAAEKGKVPRAEKPKEGQIPEEYIDVEKDPVRDASMRKSVLPSLPIDLYSIGRKYSKARNKAKLSVVVGKNGYDTMLINGEALKKLDEISGEQVPKDIYIASTCFVIESKEFSYGKTDKRKALKLILDADGYVSEKVLWPDYDTHVLNYPKALKKGAIATFFFRKKVGKKDMSIQHVVVETEEKQKPIDAE